MVFETIVSSLFYLISLASFPLIGIILGNLVDFGNRLQGNVHNDLPSSFGFLLGVLIDFYLILKVITLKEIGMMLIMIGLSQIFKLNKIISI